MSNFIIIILFIVLFIILYSNFNIELKLSRYNDNDIVIIHLKGLYGIFKYTLEIPFMDLVQGHPDMPSLKFYNKTKLGENKKHVNNSKLVINVYEIERAINKYKKIYIKYKILIKNIKKKINIYNFSWKTEIGTSDAAETAIIIGIIWTIKSCVLMFLTNSYKTMDTIIKVIPNYSNKTFRTSIDCIFSIKLGYIISATIKMLLLKLKDGVKNG